MRQALFESRYVGHLVVREGAAADALTQAAEAGSLLVCSRSALELLGAAGKRPGTVTAPSIDLADIDRLDGSLDWRSYPSIVALGAGRVTDVAKLLAARHGLPLAVLPTVLSCNAFATSSAVVRVAGRLQTARACCPDRVLIDPLVLSRTDLRWHLLGMADVLSTYTALFDWEVAAANGRERSDSLTAGWARLLSEYAFNSLEALTRCPPATACAEISRMLLMSGSLTGFYGSGRPESGSEHCIARYIEQEASRSGRLWHGEAVLIGILLATTIQGQPNARLYQFAADLKLGPSLASKGITGDFLGRSVHGAAFVRADRFTVLDVVGLSERQAGKLAADVLKRLARVSPNGAGKVLV